MNSKVSFPRLATLLADNSGRSKRFSEDFLREFFAIISEQLEAGNSVKIKGLGTFRLLRVEPRKSVDVTTGQPMEISGHSKVTFTPAKELAEAVNAPFEAFTAIEIADGVDLKDLEDEGTTPEVEVQTVETIEMSVVAIETSVEKVEAFFGQEVNDNRVDIKEDIKNTPKEVPVVEAPIDGEKEKEVPVVEAPIDDEKEEEVTVVEAPIDDEKEEEVIVVEAEVDDGQNISRIEKTDDSESQESDKNYQISHFDDTDDDEFIIIDETSEYDSDLPNEWERSRNSSGYNYEGRKKRFLKIVLVCALCAILGVLVTFAIWAVLTKPEFSKPTSASEALMAEYPDYYKTYEEEFIVQDSSEEESEVISDQAETVASQPEKEASVPTSPSDAEVYDTIGTTRYLTTMAKAHYGNNRFWPYIYEENKDHIGHPDKIRPGTPIRIPKLSKFGVNISNPNDIEKANRLASEIYARYGKKI